MGDAASPAPANVWAARAAAAKEAKRHEPAAEVKQQQKTKQQQQQQPQAPQQHAKGPSPSSGAAAAKVENKFAWKKVDSDHRPSNASGNTQHQAGGGAPTASSGDPNATVALAEGSVDSGFVTEMLRVRPVRASHPFCPSPPISLRGGPSASPCSFAPV